MKKINSDIINLGCRLNIHEGEVIKSLISGSALSNFTIINACAVTQEAEKKVWDEMDVDECTVERCIAMIQEILQVPNAFHLFLMVEEGETQISLTRNDMQRKRLK